MLVIGLGHRDRGDDAVGLIVADHLAADPDIAELVATGFLRILAWEGSELDLLDRWQADDAVVIVDAIRTGADPGHVHPLDLDQLESLATTAGGTHAFGVPGTLAVARALDRLPATLDVIGIEPATVEHGAPLTAEVARAAADVASALRVRLRSR